MAIDVKGPCAGDCDLENIYTVDGKIQDPERNVDTLDSVIKFTGDTQFERDLFVIDGIQERVHVGAHIGLGKFNVVESANADVLMLIGNVTENENNANLSFLVKDSGSSTVGANIGTSGEFGGGMFLFGDPSKAGIDAPNIHIAPGGNVSIGDTALMPVADELLHVRGNIKSEDVILEPPGVVGDGLTLASPKIFIRSIYDGDPGGGVTPTDLDTTLQTVASLPFGNLQSIFQIQHDGNTPYQVNKTSSTFDQFFECISGDNELTASFASDGQVAISAANASSESALVFDLSGTEASAEFTHDSGGTLLLTPLDDGGSYAQTFQAADGVVALTSDTLFGNDRIEQRAVARTTTTSTTYQTKVTLSTGALTGTYRVEARAVLDNGGDLNRVRLQNVTDATTFLGEGRFKATDSGELLSWGALDTIVLAGVTKDFEIQWRDEGGGSVQGIQGAIIEFFKIS